MVTLGESLKVKTSEQKFRKSWDLNGVDFCQRKRLANIVSLLSGHSWLLYISPRANATNILGRDTHHIGSLAFFFFSAQIFVIFLKRTNLQKNSAHMMCLFFDWTLLICCSSLRVPTQQIFKEGHFGRRLIRRKLSDEPRSFGFIHESNLFSFATFIKGQPRFLSYSLIWHLGQGIEC